MIKLFKIQILAFTLGNLLDFGQTRNSLKLTEIQKLRKESSN